jgi:hypothetical protein
MKEENRTVFLKIARFSQKPFNWENSKNPPTSRGVFIYPPTKFLLSLTHLQIEGGFIVRLGSHVNANSTIFISLLLDGSLDWLTSRGFIKMAHEPQIQEIGSRASPT